MTSRDKLIQGVCAAILAVCLVLSGVLATQITAEAGRAQLVYTDQASEGDPPAVAAGIAMGAFRGLFVNYLWLRANRLKEEGKFYEAIELSSAITKLQPRFPRVWAFHAWNMAYNISVATKTSEERWQWVRAGVNLLRDRAIPLNPNDVLLYKELAWIFVHKIQGFSDDANHYYKKKMAEEWTIVLGTPPPLPNSTADATQAMMDWFSPIVNAPNTMSQLVENEKKRLIQALPPEQRENPDFVKTIMEEPSPVERLVERIRKEAGLDLDFELLRLITMHQAYANAWYADSSVVQLSESDRNRALTEMLDDPELSDEWDALIPFVRRSVLRTQYNMRPYVMLGYMDRYGPLDFRHPATHSLYWASLGVEEALERKSTESHNTINTDRITMHSLQELWRTGSIFYDPITDEYLTLQNLHFTDAYGEVMEVLAERGGIAESKDRAFTLYRSGYENFLKDVIRAYYRLGDRTTAQAYFDRYIEWPGKNQNDQQIVEDLKLPLDQFVLRQLEEDRLTVPYVFTSEVFGALTDAYIRGLLGGDRRIFQSQYQYAEKVHKHYFERHSLEEIVDPTRTRMEYMPREFPETAALVLRNLITTGAIEPGQGARIYQQAPESIQKLVFDDVRATLASRGMRESVFNTLYPEPPGMEQFRKLRQAILQQQRQKLQELELQQQ